MERLEVSTAVYLPPQDIYEFLVDFPRYARYSKYLEDVRQYGDGTAGTEYDLIIGWWKITYTARSEVVNLDNPHQIDWRLTKDIDAAGKWVIEELDPQDEMGSAVDKGDVVSRVRLIAEFDTDSAQVSALNIPRYVSFDWVLNRVKPKILEEANRVVERIVADLEGEHREVELEIHETPSL